MAEQVNYRAKLEVEMGFYGEVTMPDLWPPIKQLEHYVNEAMSELNANFPELKAIQFRVVESKLGEDQNAS